MFLIQHENLHCHLFFVLFFDTKIATSMPLIICLSLFEYVTVEAKTKL